MCENTSLPNHVDNDSESGQKQKKNSDSHKPQRQYVPEHEQKDPEQLNVGIQWKLRVVRLHLGSFF